MAIQVSGSTVIHDSQDVQVSGMFTASSFVGDASQLTNLPASGGTLEATVSGTLADGDPVVVNANGTVSPISSSGFDAWIATIGGTDTDFAYGMATDGSGNVYITGFAGSSGQGSNEIVLVKYNSAGTIEWQRFLGGSGDDKGQEVAVDSSGNVYLVGLTQNSGAGSWDILIAKYDTSGTIQWQRTLGGSSSDNGYAIAVDSSDNVYITGRHYTGSRNECVIAKYNSSGSIQWQRFLSGSQDDVGESIAVDSSNNVYILAKTQSSGAGGDDLLIAKYNTSGTIQWQRTLGGTNHEYAYGMAVDSSGNVHITGTSWSTPGDALELVVAKYNTSGALQWQRYLGGTGSDMGYGVAVDSSGNVYIGGITNTSTTGTKDLLIVKYNSSGTLQYQRTLGSSGSEEGYDLVIDSSFIYIVGYTSQGAGSTDLITAKVPIDGSGTGTYGSYTYASTSLTGGTSTLTDSSSSLNSSSSSLSEASASLTDATANLTSSKTTISSLVQNLTAENYIGISDGAYTNGQTATIQVTGSVDDAQSGLTAGQAYYVQHNGTISETADSPSVFAGTAVSASKIIVKG